MTPEELRTLDAEVAEKVMGLKPCTDPVGRCEAAHMTPPQCWSNGLGSGGGSDLQSYSTSISAAWEAVERFERVEIYFQPHYPGVWVAILGLGDQFGRGDAKTLPLAVCIAALASRSAAESDAPYDPAAPA